MSQAALPHLTKGSSIINTASITAYQGNKKLIDYSSTKGAIVSFTRSLALSLVDQGIRVNAVAPGPIWTPLIPSSFSAEEVSTFGTDTPMNRAGQPYELAPAYVYLASGDSSYVTGETIHVNGGGMVTS
ncbi:General stress protein 39 [compost metagenome]